MQALQAALNLARARLVVDGLFGRATELALEAFHAARRLQVDGAPAPPPGHASPRGKVWELGCLQQPEPRGAGRAQIPVPPSRQGGTR